MRSSSIVKISYDSPNPALAAKIANALASSFIKVNLERRYNASTYARNFLQDRLTQLKAKLEESEKALVAYAEKERDRQRRRQADPGADQPAGGQQRLCQGLDGATEGPAAVGAGAVEPMV